ncbi:uncharacterized protein LOC131627441 [Vicia villosa]|uniref:uncharacterized protein LOC131627441 n=1 Tax=Vicia villosa TaxID=3911 RepID=UPI00273BDA5B|nr:uncharacterized protein LOC131627441 [Vicia villosa]
MKSLYWNIRGIANPPSRLVLKRLLKNHKPDFLFIAEPKTVFDKLPSNWFLKLGFKLFASNKTCLPSLWCFCLSDIDPNILEISDQYIAFSFVLENKLLASAAIYASTSPQIRQTLWRDLALLQARFVIPWTFLGDFNAIIGAHEHRGRLSPAKGPMKDFRSWSDSNHLIHVPTQGSFFTWSNKRGDPFFIERRLDRVVANQAWLNLCTSTSVCTLNKLRSDHFPILLDFSANPIKVISRFRFFQAWARHPGCKEVVSNCWKQKVIGSPLVVLGKKLQLLKKELNCWKHSCFGNVTQNVLQAEIELKRIQDNPDPDLVNFNRLEKDAQDKLSLALDIEESFWKEKAKIKWHVEGDRNTAYFHRLSKIRNAVKPISILRAGEEIFSESSQISSHVVEYYKSLFSNHVSLLQDFALVENSIPCMVNDEMNNMLTLLPSLEEIKAAVFSLNHDSAPGPDGFACDYSF